MIVMDSKAAPAREVADKLVLATGLALENSLKETD